PFPTRRSSDLQSMAHIKKTGIHKETIYTCYVTEQRKLVGTVSAKELMTSDDNMRIEELMETELIFVRTHTDQEEVAKLFTKYDLIADRKSTRLNSSHVSISYAVFCLKKTK